ncbi:UPF0430 protein CG31712-like isoform X2 [Macrobrachium nipponense]|uniref:UPF0430 protein CG31712-like isoform X2 n=2 Tax=Macrobrachium nipponense TaxID=159736 RepID=UPI0030C83431
MFTEMAKFHAKVVWLFVGWVRSHQDGPAQDDRDRRAYQRRRMLERLALRGYEARERERLAAELLARLESHHTSTSSPLWRQQPDHHRSLSRPNSQMFQDAPYLEVASFDQVYPQLEVLREEEVETQVEEEPEFAKVSMELEETKDVLRQFLIREMFPDKTKTRRHVAEETLTELTTRRSSTREERKKLKEEKRRKKEEKKKKRANKKNKKRKQEQEFKSYLRNQNISIHEVDGESFFDCCPSKMIVVQKAVGKASNNRAVEIMETQDTFYERVCLDEVLDKECIFPARSLKKGVVTRCAQEWSYSQAFSRPYDSAEEFKVSHIQVRSGCSCQVSLTHKKKRKRKR